MRRAVDVVVVGAGQAGIEAALACARMGVRTACVTLRLDRIGYLPCNCSIGGPAKGHIAREVDALGGQMGVTTDHSLTHTRTVGTSKGPAVQTIRAQVCKSTYPLFMRGVLETQDSLDLYQGTVESLVLDASGAIRAVRVSEGSEVYDLDCRAVVLTTGTFLNGLCHEGSKKTVAARHGDDSVQSLAAFIKDLGIRTKRFKTGTTPRVKLGSLDLSLAQVMPSEPEAGPLSFLHDRTFEKRELLPTWQTRTTPSTHEVLRENLDKSAMFSGDIEGVGPRYCPSVEDKVVRFAGKDSHPIFWEIEEWDSDSVYVQGFSSSMPAEVQLEALKTVPGMESVEMLLPGYAVEYDMADPLQLRPSLMSKLLPGLFLAGQINGTSGYEEAAGQGIVAGINAAHFALGLPEVVFPRTQSFIGVMIDDLVTKGVDDPYRMLTARAEHRLLLRHDNADQRLTPLAIELGLATTERAFRLEKKLRTIQSTKEWLSTTFVFESDLAPLKDAPVVRGRASLYELLKRPEINLVDVETLAIRLGFTAQTPERPGPGRYGSTAAAARRQIEIEAIYDGYLAKQCQEAKLAEKLEFMSLPVELDYWSMTGISHESREKLDRLRPSTIGQASRIPGVRPADVALLIGYLRGSVKSA